MPTPRQIFDRCLEGMRTGTHDFDDLLAEDCVVETPFAAGGPRRTTGRAEFLARAVPERAALPVRFDHARTLAVHETTDPEVIVAEYELGGTVLGSGRRESACFVVVLRAHDGRITHWREYQDTLAIARALA